MRPASTSSHLASAEYQREWRRRNPDRTARYRRRTTISRYGLTEGELSVLWQAQGAACASCGAREHGGRNWHIDHCHDTQVVRGVLCHRCNVALGMLRDDAERVLALFHYISEGV